LQEYSVDLAPYFIDKLTIKDKIKVKLNDVKDDDIDIDVYDDLSFIYNPDMLIQKAHGEPCFDVGSIGNGWISFEILRIISIHVHDHADDFGLTPDQMTILMRIRRNSEQLKYIVKSLQLNNATILKPSLWRRLVNRVKGRSFSDNNYFKWSDVLDKKCKELLRSELRTKRIPLSLVALEDLTFIRKAWELNTERVMAQTTIQVDGDVVTRISRNLLSEEYAGKRDVILHGHKQSTELCLAHWQGMVDVAVGLAGELIGARSGVPSKKA
jgi:hypothetical protein